MHAAACITFFNNGTYSRKQSWHAHMGTAEKLSYIRKQEFLESHFLRTRPPKLSASWGLDVAVSPCFQHLVCTSIFNGSMCRLWEMWPLVTGMAYQPDFYEWIPTKTFLYERTLFAGKLMSRSTLLPSLPSSLPPSLARSLSLSLSLSLSIPFSVHICFLATLKSCYWSYNEPSHAFKLINEERNMLGSNLFPSWPRTEPPVQWAQRLCKCALSHSNFGKVWPPIVPPFNDLKHGHEMAAWHIMTSHTSKRSSGWRRLMLHHMRHPQLSFRVPLHTKYIHTQLQEHLAR